MVWHALLKTFASIWRRRLHEFYYNTAWQDSICTTIMLPIYFWNCCTIYTALGEVHEQQEREIKRDSPRELVSFIQNVIFIFLVLALCEWKRYTMPN